MRRLLTQAFGGIARGKRFNRRAGDLGERIAERHLHARGHRLLERNWHSHTGEIDIISALPDGTIVFTEVKTRRGEEHGTPIEAFDDIKQGQVARVADDYIRMWRLERRPVRFDVIGVTVDERGVAAVEHIEGVD